MIRQLLFVLSIFWLCSSCADNRSDSGGTTGELYKYLPIEKGLNVVVVSFDALRADVLGVYNAKAKTSPNIDQFSSQALVFDQAFSAAQATPPSFCAAFTGKLPFRSFLKWEMIKGQTLASVLRNSGYITSFVTDNVQINKERNFDQGFDHFEVIESTLDEDMIGVVMKLIEKNKNTKFFSWFHFVSPHTPYDYREISKQFYDTEYNGKFKKTVPGNYSLVSNDEIKYVKQLYDGEVFFADYIFGEILRKMTDTGLANNTIIIVTSDHGEEFLDHGSLEHDSLFGEVIKIPFIVKHPHAIKTGRIYKKYSNIDLLPTLSSIIDVKFDNDLDGIDLLKENNDDREIISVAMTSEFKKEVSIILGSTKLISSCKPTKKTLTFDLYNDYGELKDMGGNHPATAKLASRLHKILGPDPCDAIESSLRGVSPVQGLTKEQVKRLKSLGYLK